MTELGTGWAPRIQPPSSWAGSRGWAHTSPHGLQPGDTSQGSCPHARGAVGRVVLTWEARGTSVLMGILCLPGATASAQGKHPEAAQEQVPALTVGTAAPSGPAGIQAVPAAGAEGSARAEAPAGEVKPLQIVVTALVHCSALEEPPAPAATPEEEQAPAPAIGVPRVPEPPPASGTTGFDP